MLFLLLSCRFSPGTSGDDSGTPAGSGDSGRDTADAPALVCTSWDGTPPDLPAPEPSANGAVGRVVRIPSDHFDELYAIVHYPQGVEPAYAGGAPVVVTAHPSLDISAGWATTMHAYFEPAFGVVEVQPVYPGWTVFDHTTTGPHDGAGPRTADALADTIRFSAGRTLTTEGYSLAEVAEQDVCNSRVVLLGASGGGSTAFEAMDARAEDVGDLLLGYAGYESPTVPQQMVGDLGTLLGDPDLDEDGDGDGYAWDDCRNHSYAPGGCTTDGCELDYGAIAWSDDHAYADLNWGFLRDTVQQGVLYLDGDGDGRLTLGADGTSDADGNGAMDADEDFILLPHNHNYSADEERLYFSAQATEAAQEALAEWPAHVATTSEVAPFWAERNLMAHVQAAAAGLDPQARAALVFTAVDHAQAQPTRPNIIDLYEALRAEGLVVRLNASQDVATCLLDPDEANSWEGGPDPGVDVVEGADSELVDQWAFSEALPAPHARAVGVLGLFWDVAGPFDRCPQGEY